MESLTYIQLENHNEDHRILLESLTIPYNHELDAGSPAPLFPEEIRFITRDMLNTLRRPGVNLELCYLDGELVGFWYGKVDDNSSGASMIGGNATILEFYIRPDFRRRGLGSAMYCRAVEVLQIWGANRIALTADPVTGAPFWQAMGFKPSGKNDENHDYPIWVKNLAHR